jgi:hypothetical protein
MDWKPEPSHWNRALHEPSQVLEGEPPRRCSTDSSAPAPQSGPYFGDVVPLHIWSRSRQRVDDERIFRPRASGGNSVMRSAACGFRDRAIYTRGCGGAGAWVGGRAPARRFPCQSPTSTNSASTSRPLITISYIRCWWFGTRITQPQSSVV